MRYLGGSAIAYLRRHLEEALGQQSATRDKARTWEMADEGVAALVCEPEPASERVWVFRLPARRLPRVIGGSL